MSDVAVTWAKAQTCMSVLKGRKGPDGVVGPDKVRVDSNAKAVLVAMASYADAEGRAWVLVDVLAMEIDKQPRMVERGRQALVDCGLLIKTAETQRYNGRNIPIYRLPLELGHASTVRRRLAEREAAMAAAASATGVTGDTRSEGPRVSPVTPDPRHRRHPTGVTGDTLIGKLNSQDQTQGAGARESEPDSGQDAPVSGVFDRVLTAWAVKAPERASRDRAWPAWVAALDRTVGGVEVDEVALERAVLAYLAGGEVQRSRTMNLDRWLTESRFEPWLLAEVGRGRTGAVDQRRRVWAGPVEVRDAVAGCGLSVAAYLDPAGWDGEARTVLAATGVAAERLKREAGRALKALNVGVAIRTSHPQHERASA